MTQHTSRHYEQELQVLKEKVLLLGGKVEEMIAAAMKSLLDRKPDLARRVIDSDRAVDSGELEIDHLCLSLLALRQPAASDLRFIATAKIEELIFELKKDYTIVIVTHNMQQAARVSEFTAFFMLGRLVEYDRTEKIFTNPGQKITEDYITGRFG